MHGQKCFFPHMVGTIVTHSKHISKVLREVLVAPTIKHKRTPTQGVCICMCAGAGKLLCQNAQSQRPVYFAGPYLWPYDSKKFSQPEALNL